MANQYGESFAPLSCDTCMKPLSRSNFSPVIKGNASKGYRTTCKKCSRNKKLVEIRNRTWHHDSQKIMFNNAKARAHRSGIEFALVKEDVVIPERCPVLDIELKREGKETWNSAPSIDRVDNTKGYTPENIQVISRRANILKRDATFDELIRIGKYYEHFFSRQTPR